MQYRVGRFQIIPEEKLWLVWRQLNNFIIIIIIIKIDLLRHQILYKTFLKITFSF